MTPYRVPIYREIPQGGLKEILYQTILNIKLYFTKINILNLVLTNSSPLSPSPSERAWERSGFKGLLT